MLGPRRRSCQGRATPTERRRSRTYRAVGCTTALVLKTSWATGPMPLRYEPIWCLRRLLRRSRGQSACNEGLTGGSSAPVLNAAGPPGPCRSGTSLASAREAQAALVADSAGDAVGVVALEEKLCGPARYAELITERRERDG